MSVISSDTLNSLNQKPFKQRKSLATRKEEVAEIRCKFPNKLPIIIERYSKEVNLPMLLKTKFLVPQELTMSQLVNIIRRKLKLNMNQALYLIINNRSIVSMSKPLAEVYREEKDEDGFLYVVYASQQVFGSDDTMKHCVSNKIQRG